MNIKNYITAIFSTLIVLSILGLQIMTDFSKNKIIESKDATIESQKNEIIELQKQIEELQKPIAKKQVINNVLKKDDTRLTIDSELYKNRTMPRELIYAIHNVETGNRTNYTGCNKSNSCGNMQFQPSTWKGYCKDLTLGVISDDITCADRYLTANFNVGKKLGMTDKEAYRKAIWQYNHSEAYYKMVKGRTLSVGFEL